MPCSWPTQSCTRAASAEKAYGSTLNKIHARHSQSASTLARTHATHARKVISSTNRVCTLVITTMYCDVGLLTLENEPSSGLKSETSGICPGSQGRSTSDYIRSDRIRAFEMKYYGYAKQGVLPAIGGTYLTLRWRTRRFSVPDAQSAISTNDL